MPCRCANVRMTDQTAPHSLSGTTSFRRRWPMRKSLSPSGHSVLLGVDAARGVELPGIGEAGEFGNADESGVLSVHLPAAARAAAELVNTAVYLVRGFVPIGGCQLRPRDPGLAVQLVAPGLEVGEGSSRHVMKEAR